MKSSSSLEHIAGMDIYLIDQIMKGRYLPGQSILDAGAGGGRNLNWFFSHGFRIDACDIESEREEIIRCRFPKGEFEWQTTDISALPYDDGKFDHVICNAVLHFASSHAHFDVMFSELIRVLRPKGSIFIRTCSDIGIKERAISLGDGCYNLPDGSRRYLISRKRIEALLAKHNLAHLEAVKSVNVDDQRVMTTLVMVKGGDLGYIK
jgi:2-polyprenyl-3-methyl-5-hydroxy-6-metoxy-1,4-benzoquinol methylase